MAHPLRTLKQDLQLHGQCLEVPLAPLSAAGVAMYLARRFPDGLLPDELTQQIYQRTDGNPLFLVNMVEHLVIQGLLVQHDGRWELHRGVPGIDVSVPESLRQMITQQFDHLPPTEQRLVEVGSVVGVEFAASARPAGLDEDPSEVEGRCEALAQRRHVLRSVEVVEWPDGTITGRYAFQHALYQQVAYQRLGASQRVYLHRRVGERLEMAYGQRAPELAAELAEHFIRGREPRRAVQYLRQAAETALAAACASGSDRPPAAGARVPQNAARHPGTRATGVTGLPGPRRAAHGHQGPGSSRGRRGLWPGLHPMPAG